MIAWSAASGTRLTPDGRGNRAGSDRPAQAMVRPGEIRATADLTAGSVTEIVVCLRPDGWPRAR